MLVQQYNKILENIIVGQSIYSKSILKLKKTKHLGILDFYNDISNSLITEKNTVGDSILYSNYLFKHKNYKEIRFKSFLTYYYLDKEYSFILKIIKTLKTLNIRKKRKYMTINYPVKGGFFGYSLGISGFMPKSHLKKVIIKSIINVFLKTKELATKIFFYNLHKYNQLLSMYVPFKLGKVTILSSTLRNNFSLKNKKKKRKIFPAKLNVVFLSSK